MSSPSDATGSAAEVVTVAMCALPTVTHADARVALWEGRGIAPELPCPSSTTAI